MLPHRWLGSRTSVSQVFSTFRKFHNINSLTPCPTARVTYKSKQPRSTDRPRLQLYPSLKGPISSLFPRDLLLKLLRRLTHLTSHLNRLLHYTFHSHEFSTSNSKAWYTQHHHVGHQAPTIDRCRPAPKPPNK